MREYARRLVERLCREHHGDLQRALTRRLGSAQTAADVAQEAYMRLLRIDTASDIREPHAFLFRTAANLAVNTLKRRRRDAEGAQALAHLAEATTPHLEPERQVEGAELQEAIEAAILAMPPRRREVFVLHRYRDLSQIEIARLLGLSLVAVEKHIGAALNDCRAHLRRAGVLDDARDRDA